MNRFLLLCLILFPLLLFAEDDIIIVSGVSDIRLEPDIVYIRVGVETYGTNPIDLFRENSERTQRLIEYLKKQKVITTSIKTVDYTLYSERDNYYATTTTGYGGYTLRNVIEFRTDKLEDIGKLLDGCINSGGNIVQGVEYSHFEYRQKQLEVLASAVENARLKADYIAKSSNRVLGKIHKIEEDYAWYPSFAAEGGGESAPPTPTIPGLLKLEASVRITFILE